MKDDGVNRDTTIEVGDLVRVVAPPIGYEQDAGFEFVVERIDREGCVHSPLGQRAPSDVYLFNPSELEIMTPKAELESVYHEDKVLQEKKDKLWELCESYDQSAGFMTDSELGSGVRAIFNED